MAGDQPSKPANDNAQAAQKPANDNAGKTGPPPGGAGGGDKAPASQPPADKPSQPQQQGQQQGDRGQQGQQPKAEPPGAQREAGGAGNQGGAGRPVTGEAGPAGGARPQQTGAGTEAQRGGDRTQANQTAGIRGEVPAGASGGGSQQNKDNSVATADRKASDASAAKAIDARQAGTDDAKGKGDGSTDRKDGNWTDRSIRSDFNRASGSDKDAKAGDKDAKTDGKNGDKTGGGGDGKNGGGGGDAGKAEPEKAPAQKTDAPMPAGAPGDTLKPELKPSGGMGTPGSAPSEARPGGGRPGQGGAGDATGSPGSSGDGRPGNWTDRSIKPDFNRAAGTGDGKNGGPGGDKGGGTGSTREASGKVGGAGGDSAALASTGAESLASKAPAPGSDAKAQAGPSPAGGRLDAGAKAVGVEQARLQAAGTLDDKTNTTLGAAQHGLTSEANRVRATGDSAETSKAAPLGGSSGTITSEKGPVPPAAPSGREAQPPQNTPVAAEKAAVTAASNERVAAEQPKAASQPPGPPPPPDGPAEAGAPPDPPRPGDSVEQTDTFRNLTPEQKAEFLDQLANRVNSTVEARRADPHTSGLHPAGYDPKGGAATWEDAVRRDYKSVSATKNDDGTHTFRMAERWPHDGTNHGADKKLGHQFSAKNEDTLNRIGRENGAFMAVGKTDGIPDHLATFDQRALPCGHAAEHFADYKITKDFTADVTKAADAFGRDGGGWQVDMKSVRLTPDSTPGKTPTGQDITVEWMHNNGYLERTYSTDPAHRSGT